MSTSPSNVKTGQVLADRYRIERLLGEGGMGAVFSAQDLRSMQTVAVKLLVNCDDPAHVTRFFREARATMRVSSNHVVRVLEVGSADGRMPFMVMERLDGSNLKQLTLNAERIELRWFVDLVIQACEGLAHAHSQGIVHRDIKPSNLFVVGGNHLKVLDFGISKVTSYHDWERTSSVTASEALLGSPHFISPEQLRNAAGVDERADVWSLGVVLYQILARRFPFDGASLAEILVSILHKRFLPLADVAPMFAAMDPIIAKCLERDLGKRYQDVGELAMALAPHASPYGAGMAAHVVTIVGDSRSRQAKPDWQRSVEGTISLADGPPPQDDDMDTVAAPPPRAEAFSLPSVSGASVSSIDLRATRQPLRRAVTAAAIGAALVVALVTSVVVINMQKRNAVGVVATPASTSASPPEVPSPPSSLSTLAPHDQASEPALELIADAPITKVVVANAQRVALEGGRAFVTVPPWQGDLPIEAELSTGGFARGAAKAGGPTTIHLTTAKRTQTRGPQPARSGRTPGTAGAPPKSELHDDPYSK